LFSRRHDYRASLSQTISGRDAEQADGCTRCLELASTRACGLSIANALRAAHLVRLPAVSPAGPLLREDRAVKRWRFVAKKSRLDEFWSDEYG
jgi:hypothetical protein